MAALLYLPPRSSNSCGSAAQPSGPSTTGCIGQHVSLAVQTVLRRLGSTQTHLVEGADGYLYVAKRTNENDRDLFWASLASHLELPMARWTVLEMDGTNVLREEPDHGKLRYLSFQLPMGVKQIYEYIPLSWMRGTDVARDIVRVQVFDYWVNNTSPRHYVAYRKMETSQLEMAFTDTTSAFKDPLGCGDLLIAPGRNPYLNAERLGVEHDVVNDILDRISGVMRIRLERLMKDHAPDGQNDSVDAMILDLLAVRQHAVLCWSSQWSQAAKRSRQTAQA